MTSTQQSLTDDDSFVYSIVDNDQEFAARLTELDLQTPYGGGGQTSIRFLGVHDFLVHTGTPVFCRENDTNYWRARALADLNQVVANTRDEDVVEFVRLVAMTLVKRSILSHDSTIAESLQEMAALVVTEWEEWADALGYGKMMREGPYLFARSLCYQVLALQKLPLQFDFLREWLMNKSPFHINESLKSFHASMSEEHVQEVMGLFDGAYAEYDDHSSTQLRSHVSMSWNLLLDNGRLNNGMRRNTTVRYLGESVVCYQFLAELMAPLLEETQPEITDLFDNFVDTVCRKNKNLAQNCDTAALLLLWKQLGLHGTLNALSAGLDVDRTLTFEQWKKYFDNPEHRDLPVEWWVELA